MGFFKKKQVIEDGLWIGKAAILWMRLLYAFQMYLHGGELICGVKSSLTLKKTEDKFLSPYFLKSDVINKWMNGAMLERTLN